MKTVDTKIPVAGNLQHIMNLCVGLPSTFFGRVLNGPIHVQIEPTSRCNLRCRMCVRNRAKNIDLPLNAFKQIIESLPTVRNIMLQGLGEPFINPDFLAMVTYATRNKRYVATVSNGTLLQGYSHAIAHSGLRYIGISLDSPHPHIFESIREGSSFRMVVDNIEALVRASEGTPLDVALYVTLGTWNISDAGTFVRLADDLGIRHISLSTIVRMDTYVSLYKIEGRRDGRVLSATDLNSTVRTMKHEGSERGIRISFRSSGCLWPWLGLYVTVTGDVTPCCRIHDPSCPRVANILQSPLRSFWNGPALVSLRRAILQGGPVPDYCQGCEKFERGGPKALLQHLRFRV